ncbi:hypothetical protein OQA88_2489 [Cercophora sp. LCS_1]
MSEITEKLAIEHKRVAECGKFSKREIRCAQKYKSDGARPFTQDFDPAEDLESADVLCCVGAQTVFPTSSQQFNKPIRSELLDIFTSWSELGLAKTQDEDCSGQGNAAVGDDVSTYGVSNNTSIASSIYKYRVENGRTYHAFKAGEVDYVLPNDQGSQYLFEVNATSAPRPKTTV